MPSPSDDVVVGGQKRSLGRRVCLLFLFLNLGEAESACQLKEGDALLGDGQWLSEGSWGQASCLLG